MDTIMEEEDKKFLRKDIIWEPSLVAWYIFPKFYQPLWLKDYFSLPFQGLFS